MKNFFKYLITAAVAFLAAACGFEDLENIDYPQQQEGYLTLLGAYNDGKTVYDIIFQNGTLIVTFDDSSKLRIKDSAIKFEDKRQAGAPSVKYSEISGKWMVNGKMTKESEHRVFTDNHSRIVYAYYDWNTIHVYLSNGKELHFPYAANPHGPIKKFTIPRIYLTHKADKIHKGYYVDGTFAIADPDKAYSAVDSLSCAVQIKGRGNTSWGMPKQPYKLKLETKQSLLGMPANRDWVLLNNYSDKSLLRTMVAMELSRIVGMTWTPRCMNVELYLNNEYRGVYCLIEHKEVAKNRVNIKPITPDAPDTRGDYYLEIESSTDAPCIFTSSKGVPFQFKDPEYPNDEQFEYVKDYINSFEAAISDYKIRGTESGYRKYIDVESFVNYYIVEELVKNIDGTIFKSNFLTLEDGKNLKFYHLWDFDITMGNCNYLSSGTGPEGWYIKGARWYGDLFYDGDFVKAVKKKWTEVYPKFKTIPEYIDKCAAEMGDAPARNFKKWKILGVYVWPNVVAPDTYGEEIDYLKKFFSDRLEWMNIEIMKLKEY